MATTYPSALLLTATLSLDVTATTLPQASIQLRGRGWRQAGNRGWNPGAKWRVQPPYANTEENWEKGSFVGSWGWRGGAGGEKLGAQPIGLSRLYCHGGLLVGYAYV